MDFVLEKHLGIVQNIFVHYLNSFTDLGFLLLPALLAVLQIS